MIEYSVAYLAFVLTNWKVENWVLTIIPSSWVITVKQPNCLSATKWNQKLNLLKKCKSVQSFTFLFSFSFFDAVLRCKLDFSKTHVLNPNILDYLVWLFPSAPRLLSGDTKHCQLFLFAAWPLSEATTAYWSLISFKSWQQVYYSLAGQCSVILSCLSLTLSSGVIFQSKAAESINRLEMMLMRL